jgi:RsiW-degrading membrane proteinase PrsW (M82 family)
MYFVIIGFITLATSLVWFLLKHDHGRSLPVGSLWIASGFGFAATIAAFFLETFILPKEFLVSPLNVTRLQSLLLFIVVGLIEETVKFAPLAIFIYKRSYFKEHTDGVIYFAISGLTFGLGENLLYTFSYGSKVGLTRLIMTPFFHAAGTSILGYYLVSSKINKNTRKKFIAACLIVPLLHGFYDFGLASGVYLFQVFSLMITLLLSLGLFLYFMNANDLDKATLAPAYVKHNSFCTNCGRQNISNSNFCETCGHPL